jgi:hypothetical protein
MKNILAATDSMIRINSIMTISSWLVLLFSTIGILVSTIVVATNDEYCSICGNGQILTKSDNIIPMGTINFINNDISCLYAELQSIEWTIEQCTYVRMTTNTSTVCGCETPIIDYNSVITCNGICRKGEIITNPNTVLSIGTINFLSTNITCQQAQIDSETVWTNDQCMIVKDSTNVASICGCDLNPRPILDGTSNTIVWDTTLPSSNNMRRRRSHHNNASDVNNIFD